MNITTQIPKTVAWSSIEWSLRFFHMEYSLILGSNDKRELLFKTFFGRFVQAIKFYLRLFYLITQ
jgi:hypothetical protein